MKERIPNTDPVFVRIDELMSKQGKKGKDLTDHLGLAKGTYTNWKTSLSSSYLSHLGKICSYLHTTPNYIIYGDPEEDHPYIRRAIDPNESLMETDLLSVFRQLKSVRQNDLIRIAKMMTVD